MKRLFFSLFVLALVGLILRPGGVAEAVISNGGFEAGLTDWTAFIPSGGSAHAVTTHTGSQGTAYGPIEGGYFAELKTDGPDSYITLSQTFSISSGLWIEGWAAFDTRDHLPYNDNAAVDIFDAAGNFMATPWYLDVLTLGDDGDGPWEYWSWTAPESGNYTLQLYVVNSLGSGLDSCALFDAVKVVPEPATMLLFGSGLLGLAFGRKRKKRV